MAQSNWTPERVKILTTMWDGGNSASTIARRLGNVTRNAVVGKVHRLKLAARTTLRGRESDRYTRFTSKRQAKPVPRRKPAFVAPPIPPAEPLPEPTAYDVIPLKIRKTVATREKHHCAWPIGDPKDASFHFCSRPTTTGKPYCEPHCHRAYQAPKPRKPRDEAARYAASKQAINQHAATRLKGKPFVGAD